MLLVLHVTIFEDLKEKYRKNKENRSERNIQDRAMKIALAEEYKKAERKEVIKQSLANIKLRAKERAKEKAKNLVYGNRNKGFLGLKLVEPSPEVKALLYGQQIKKAVPQKLKEMKSNGSSKKLMDEFWRL